MAHGYQFESTGRSWLQSGGAPRITAFWITMVTAGPWPSGPAWFVAVLLLFDMLAAQAFMGGFVPGPSRPDWPRVPQNPWHCFFILLAASLLAYLPPLTLFGPWRWITAGPFAVQASRIGLYLVYFLAGVACGAVDAGALRAHLARRWRGWLAGARRHRGAGADPHRDAYLATTDPPGGRDHPVLRRRRICRIGRVSPLRE
jgi:hypothetical protein